MIPNHFFILVFSSSTLYLLPPLLSLQDPLCFCSFSFTFYILLLDFETLANRIIGLPAPMALSCFISGLLPSIRREVQVMQPATMSQAVAYARLHEEKQNDVRRTFRPTTGASSNSCHQPAPTPPSVSPLLPTPTRPNSSTVPFKRLTPEELAMRREKGLCFPSLFLH